MIGSVIHLMKYLERYTPTNAPAPIAYSELMILFRSSDRCSKNVICPPLSSSRAALGLSGWLLLVRGGGRLARPALALHLRARRCCGLVHASADGCVYPGAR